jgi:CheY-like chemotaxis protein
MRSVGILVVDDNPEVLKLLVRVLQAEGFTTFSANSGQQAIEVLRAHHEAITGALVDFLMPKPNGVATLHALLQVKPWLACCLITGGVADDLDLRAMPCICILHKPFSVGRLTDCVQLLHRKTLSEEPATLELMAPEGTVSLVRS